MGNDDNDNMAKIISYSNFSTINFSYDPRSVKRSIVRKISILIEYCRYH